MPAVYLASMLNERRLFSRAGGWMRTNKHVIENLFPFLYRANCAMLSLYHMSQFEVLCLREFAPFRPFIRNPAPEIGFMSPALLCLVSQFTVFLSSLRILQNLTIPIAAKAYGSKANIAESMKGAVRNLHRLSFPGEAKDRIIEYWEIHGRAVKAYRDLDHHYYDMTDAAVLRTTPSERVIVYLPDDPGATSRKRCTFRKKVNAVDFFQNEFDSFNTFFEGLAEALGAPAAPIDSFHRPHGPDGITPIAGEQHSHGFHVETPSALRCITSRVTSDCHLVIEELFREGAACPYPPDSEALRNYSTRVVEIPTEAIDRNLGVAPRDSSEPIIIKALLQQQWNHFPFL